MKIKILEEREVVVSDAEQKRIALDFIYKKFNWGANYFIEDNFVFDLVDGATSHSFKYKNFLRNATPLDFQVEKIVSEIKIS